MTKAMPKSRKNSQIPRNSLPKSMYTGFDLVHKLRFSINEDFGKKCKEFNFACAACGAHLAIEILESLYDPDLDIDKFKRVG